MGEIPARLDSLLPGFVPGHGRRGGLVLVGEAPGAQEVAKKKGFVGPAGSTLRSAFARLGAPKMEEIAWITNAVPYRPPGNRPPEPDEVDFYRSYLAADIEQAQPRVVVLLGNKALASVRGTHKLKITKERGKPFWHNGWLCMPTVHPSFVRRNPAAYKWLRSDLAEAIRLARGGEERQAREVRYAYVPEHLLDKAVDKLIAAGGLRAADIETTGLDIQSDRILDLGVRLTNDICLVFSGDFTHGTLLNKSMQRLFDPKNSLRWLWQNGKFDIAFLQRDGIYGARVDEDNMLAHYCLDEGQGGHDLKTLSEELLGAPSYDLSKKEKSNMDKVPKKRRWTYLAKDVIYLHDVFSIVRPQVAKDPHLEKLYTETLIPVCSVLTTMEADGIKVDLEQLDKLDVILTKERDELTAGIREAVGKPNFNPNSFKQVQVALYDGDPFHLPLLKGFGRTSRALALERLESYLEGHPSRMDLGETLERPLTFLKLMRKIRKVAKRKGTYIDGVRRRLADDGRIHTSFKQHGTRTGRLSSEEPNMHSIPRDPDIRAIFCAETGNVLIEVDWSQVELRLIADKSRDPILVRVYQNDEDLHDEVVKTVVAPLQPRLSYTEQRFQAKIVNFGIAYGRGADSMARDYDLPKASCEAIIAGWTKRFALASAFLESQGEKAVSGKILVTRFGRKRRFGFITREVANHVRNEGKNFEIQSEASDLTSRCAVMLRKILPREVKIVNTVHDSLLLEIPADPQRIKDTVLLCIERMEALAVELFNSPVPFVADAKIGTHWGYCRDLPRPEHIKEYPLWALAKLSTQSACPKDATGKRSHQFEQGYCHQCGEAA